MLSTGPNKDDKLSEGLLFLCQERGGGCGLMPCEIGLKSAAKCHSQFTFLEEAETNRPALYIHIHRSQYITFCKAARLVRSIKESRRWSREYDDPALGVYVACCSPGGKRRKNQVADFLKYRVNRRSWRLTIKYFQMIEKR
jgi:hypothetical protein